MAHKFFKRSSVDRTLPSNISPDSWAKIKKRAHDVWDMTAQDDHVEAIRKRVDTAKVTTASEDCEPVDPVSVGDMVLLFLGGQRLEARVATVVGDQLSLTSSEGVLENIPTGWVKKL